MFSFMFQNPSVNSTAFTKHFSQMLLKLWINLLTTETATLESVSDLGESEWNIDYHVAEDCSVKLSEASNGNIYEKKLESLGL